MAEVTVVARIKALPTRKEAVRQVLISLMQPTRSEPGCVSYDLHVAADDETLFMIHEKWKSGRDLNEHLQKPYIKAFVEKTGELLAEPVEISLWEKIA